MPVRQGAGLSLATVAVILCGVGLVSEMDDGVWSALAATVLRNSVPVQALDSPPATGTTVYLVVGSDRRPASPDTVHDVQGERADAIMLVTVPASGSPALLSVPRDVRVHVPGHGDGKLGGALSYGRPALISSVRALTGLPIHHYVELSFSQVATVAETLGGVPITLPRAARDAVTGLDLPAGSHRLDGASALAFVRSRHYEELTGGAWTADGSGDVGRIGRQHQFLAGALQAFRSRCRSLVCARLMHDLSRAVTVDRSLGGGELRRLARAVGSLGSRAWLSTLPTHMQHPPEDSMSPFPPAHPGNAVYRVPDQPAATTAVAQLMSHHR